MKKNIYIVSCTRQGGIYHYLLDEDGKLEFADSVALDRPMYMAVSGKKMYVVLREAFADETSGVISFDICDGRLENPSDIITTKGKVACYISVFGDDVLIANYISGSVLKLPDKLVQHSGKGVDPKRQEGPHAHFCGETPDGKYICAVDLGLDTIFVYNKDMSLFSKASVPKGHGARHIAFSKDGKYMFCANELKSTVSAFRYYDGLLEPITTQSTLPVEFKGENTAAAIRIKDGFIYVSNRGHDSISKMKFENDKLTLLEVTDCCGKSPRDFDFVGDFLICTNQCSDNVTVLKCSDGKLEKTDTEIKISEPLCVVSVE